MLTYVEFANLIEECIKTSKILKEDNAIAFAQGVIVPYLSGKINSYTNILADRKKAAFKKGDKVDEGTAEAFAFGVQKELRKKFPKIPKEEDPRDFDFYQDNKGFWYNIALNYYNDMKKKGLVTSSNQYQRSKAISSGMGKNSKSIHDSGLEGYPLSNNEKYFNY